MSADRLAELLNELLSDDGEVSSQGSSSGDYHGFDLSTETRLFDERELETAISDLERTERRVPWHDTRELVERQNLGFTGQQQVAENPPIERSAGRAGSVPQSGTTEPTALHDEHVARGIELPQTDDGTPLVDYPELNDVERKVHALWSKTSEVSSQSSLLERIKRALIKAEDDWNSEGRPDAHGGMIGGSVALRVNSMENPLSNALQNQARYGTPLVICERRLRGLSQLTAVGTSRGLVIVQLWSQSLGVIPTYELFELNEAKGTGSVSALSFSAFSEKEKLMLAVGNTEANVSIWDVSARKCLVSMSGHAGVICGLKFLSGRAQGSLLSVDSNGALHCHTLTSWVVRTSVSTRILAEGNKQPVTLSVFPDTREGDEAADTDSVTASGEGMVCLCHPNICSIGRLLPEGRLPIFYQIPKPVTVSSDVMALAAWEPLGRDVTYAVHPTPEIDGLVPHGVLAMAWDRQLSLLKIPLLMDPLLESASSKQHAARPRETSEWIRLAHELHVTSMAMWESTVDEDGVIVHVCWLPNAKLGIIRNRGILSQFLLFDKKLNVVDRVEVDDCPVGQTLRTEPTELCTSVHSVSVSGTTVSILGSMAVKTCQFLRWKDSVDVLISIQKWLMALHLLAAFHCQATNQSYYHGVGEPQLGQRMLDLVKKSISDVIVAYLDWALEARAKESSVVLDNVADVVTDMCIWSAQAEVLFAEVFPRFLRSDAKDVFLEKIEKSLVSNELKARVPPEVMQSLVEYCCEIGAPEKVERCVLRMDISSLDLNQVIPLCIEHHLFTALLFIFNNSLLQDCMTPAKYLVAAVTRSESLAEAHDYGMKLLLYIRCCLFGDSYPPGREEVDMQTAGVRKQQIMGFLLFTSTQELERIVLMNSEGSQSRQEEQTAAAEEHRQPFPVLRCLLSIHAPLILRMLKNALENWLCMEKDLLETMSGGAVEEMTSVRTVCQVVVDALIKIMDDSPVAIGLCLDFLSHCVSAGLAVVNPSIAMKLLEHLSTSSGDKQMHAYVETEEEIRFCGVVRSVGVEIEASHRSSMKLTSLEGHKALGLAMNANMLTAAALLHHMFGDYKAALEHHIKAGTTSVGSCFSYFETAAANFVDYRKTEELEKLKGAVLDCMSELATLDPQSAASMVMRHFPNDQEAVIQGLGGSRDLLFKYLSSSMDAALNQEHVALSADRNQLLTKSHCTTYVSLLCEFDPSRVLAFLKSYDHLVDVEQCKQDCMTHGLKEGAAHLMEREGDVLGALRVLTEKIQEVNGEMEKTVISRSLDSLDASLPRQLSLSAILRVSTTPDSRLHHLPPVVGEAQSSLTSAVMLCRRNSLDPSKNDRGNEARKQETLKLWFSLLEVYVDAFKKLPSYMKKQKRSSHIPSGFYQKGIVKKKQDQFQEYPRLAFLRDIYSALADEAINAMADYVSLVEIAELLIAEHGQDRFGDYRSTFLSLINAYNYELSILMTTGKLLSTDAYRALTACYKEARKRAVGALLAATPPLLLDLCWVLRLKNRPHPGVSVGHASRHDVP